MEEESNPLNWSPDDVHRWAMNQNLCETVLRCLNLEQMDGEVLLTLTEDDIRVLRYRFNYMMKFSEMKKFWLAVHALQTRCAVAGTTTVRNATAAAAADQLGQLPCGSQSSNCKLQHMDTVSSATPQVSRCCSIQRHCATQQSSVMACHCLGGDNSLPPYASIDSESFSPPMSVDGRATNIPPEFFKTAISLGYSFLVTWITSFVMVIVHERVPDMKRYPPLPDIFLDNVPHIPWAFNMCEITGTLLFTIWACVCILHKYRMVLLRRFFALAGTVFLLRCVTMLITSLSVPGTHLQCNQNDYAIDDTGLTTAEAIQQRISRAYTIWSGLGMSIQGVRTCGDYMFSGHTVALTLLNFFITEYTPRNLYFLHTLSWLLNMFGIFFILAAHEHYSIDVFVAFYITSRLFLYYHTLANNQALMSRDSNRTRIWFPMFSYFESSVDGIIPNEYDNFGTLLESLWHCVLEMKDACMLTARRYWINTPQFNITSKNVLFIPNNNVTVKQRHAATSTNSSAVFNTPTPNTSTPHANSHSNVAYRSEDTASITTLSSQMNTTAKESGKNVNVTSTTSANQSASVTSKKDI